MSEISEGARALAQALTEEGTIYTSLLALAAREEEAITGGDVSELTDITGEKEHLLELLATLETERMTALNAIAAAAGAADQPLTLSAASSLLDAGPGARLTEAGMELRARAEALRQANERNAELLRASGELVGRWIQYLKTIVGASLTYTAEGSRREEGGPGALDQSA